MPSARFLNFPKNSALFLIRPFLIIGYCVYVTLKVLNFGTVAVKFWWKKTPSVVSLGCFAAENYFLIKLICKLKLEKSLVNSFNLTYILETIIHLPLYDVLWNHLNHIILGGKSHNYTQPHICWCKKISIWKNNAYSFMSCYRLTNIFRFETLHSRIVAETMTKNKTEINNWTTMSLLYVWQWCR